MDRYTCECLSNYMGVLCEQHICEVQTPCLNNGTCAYDGSCTCSPTFTGKLCESDICQGIQCENTSECVNGRCLCIHPNAGIVIGCLLNYIYIEQRLNANVVI